jgi:hypothetical protein
MPVAEQDPTYYLYWKLRRARKSGFDDLSPIFGKTKPSGVFLAGACPLVK